MSDHRLRLCALLVSACLASACTTDFTGYRLESSDAGVSGEPSSAGGLASDTGGTADPGTTAGGRAPSSGGAGGEVTSVGGTSSSTGGDGMLASSGATDSAEAGSPDIGGAAGAASTSFASCADLASTCGPSGTASCCSTSTVQGGTFARSNRAGAIASVSSFALDDYEVSVGRFRQFIQAYSQKMIPAGAGKNPSNRLDPGWSAAWNAKLDATPAALSAAVTCATGNYTADAGPNESQPMTCVNWYEAFAFCVWDGGRLPTEAEWNYAAAGGSEERTYPWGNTAPDPVHAVFCPGACTKVLPVGSKAPAGNGKWGQSDLVGNVWEWNLDVYADPYPQGSCADCANTDTSDASTRVFSGGSAANDASILVATARNNRDPSNHNGFVGLRCARPL